MKPTLQVEYAARTRPTKKDQDCFFVVPHSTHALTCGITDGHSVHDLLSGRQHAEAAAQHLGSDLWKRVRGELVGPAVDSIREETDDAQYPSGSVEGSAVSSAVGGGGGVVEKNVPQISAQSGGASATLIDAATESFLAHQRRCEQRYRRDVAGAILAKKEELEKEIGEELPLELPQEGGTTATALVIYPDGILAAWVGDSRAVIAMDAAADGEPGAGASGLRAVALTTDHNTEDLTEKNRLEGAGGRAGGAGMNGHVSVPQAEGSLKVTRSLGDSPFHKDDAVSAIPGVVHIPLSPAIRFAVIASDGIWDHLSNSDVVDIIAQAMRTSTGADRPTGPGFDSATPAPPGISKQRSNVAVISAAASAACEAVLDRIDRGQESGELDRSHQDDRSICVVLLSKR